MNDALSRGIVRRFMASLPSMYGTDVKNMVEDKSLRKNIAECAFKRGVGRDRALRKLRANRYGLHINLSGNMIGCAMPVSLPGGVLQKDRAFSQTCTSFICMMHDSNRQHTSISPLAFSEHALIRAVQRSRYDEAGLRDAMVNALDAFLRFAIVLPKHLKGDGFSHSDAIFLPDKGGMWVLHYVGHQNNPIKTWSALVRTYLDASMMTREQEAVMRQMDEQAAQRRAADDQARRLGKFAAMRFYDAHGVEIPTDAE